MPCWSALNFSVSFRVFRGQPDWVRLGSLSALFAAMAHFAARIFTLSYDSSVSWAGFRDRSVDALYLSAPFVVGRRAWRAEAAPYFNPPLHFRVI